MIPAARWCACRRSGRAGSVSLDHFGTGFASLAYLKRMPLEPLKLDRSFVRCITTSPRDASIVGAVIAVGVECDEQRTARLAQGRRQFQGYLFRRPVPLAAFEEPGRGRG